MSDNGNPYFELIDVIVGQIKGLIKVPFLIGEVISISPLLIKAGDTQLFRKDVLINEMLLTGYKRSFEVNSGTEYDADLTAKEGLKVRDQVLILASEEMQTYVVVAKLV